MVLSERLNSCYEEKYKVDKKKLAGGGKKAADENMEEALLSWIGSTQQKPLRSTSYDHRTSELATGTEIKASRGWVR